MTAPLRPEQVAALPGVGRGLLDTLGTMLQQPIRFRNTPSDRVLGEFQRRGTSPADTATVVLNMLGLEQLAERRRPFAFGTQTPAGVLAHEVIGHGLLRLTSSEGSEREADIAGRAFLRLTGRGQDLSPPTIEELRMIPKVQALLKQFFPKKRNG